MNEKAEWEIVDDDAPHKQHAHQQRFNQKDFLFSLLGKYPRLKLAGMATAGVLVMTLVAFFSLVVLAGATVAGALVLCTAWLKTKFYKNKRHFEVNIAGK